MNDRIISTLKQLYERHNEIKMFMQDEVKYLIISPMLSEFDLRIWIKTYYFSEPLTPKKFYKDAKNVLTLSKDATKKWCVVIETDQNGSVTTRGRTEGEINDLFSDVKWALFYLLGYHLVSTADLENPYD